MVYVSCMLVDGVPAAPLIVTVANPVDADLKVAEALPAASVVTVTVPLLPLNVPRVAEKMTF